MSIQEKSIITPEDVQHVDVGSEVSVKYQIQRTCYDAFEEPSYITRSGVILTHENNGSDVRTQIEQPDGYIITIDTFPKLEKYGWVFSPHNSLGNIVEVFQ